MFYEILSINIFSYMSILLKHKYKTVSFKKSPFYLFLNQKEMPVLVRIWDCLGFVFSFVCIFVISFLLNVGFSFSSNQLLIGFYSLLTHFFLFIPLHHVLLVLLVRVYSRPASSILLSLPQPASMLHFSADSHLPISLCLLPLPAATTN